jgi:putative methyltransferase (TIGR04325 family)
MRRLRTRADAPAWEAPEWEYVPEGWVRTVRGWDVDELAATYRARWPEFGAAVAGSGPLGVAHEVPVGVPVPREDHGWHNIVVGFGYVLARAARGRMHLSLLDWGGGPGHYAVLARALLPELELEYHSRDLPKLAKLGRELLPEYEFHADDDCLRRTYDLVLASDSLQYAEDLNGTLHRLARATGSLLFVALLPVVQRAKSFVVLQRPNAYGYETEYLGWVVNRCALLEAAGAAGLVLERELLAAGEIDAAGAPERANYRSFLFRRVAR